MNSIYPGTCVDLRTVHCIVFGISVILYKNMSTTHNHCGERRIFYSIQPRHRHGFPRRFPRVTGTHEWIRRQPLAVRDVIPVRLSNRSLTHIRGPSPCVGGPMRAVDTSWKPSTVEFPSVEPQDGGFGIETRKRIDAL